MDHITPKELADKWGISKRAVLKHLENDQIPGAFKDGRNWRVPKDAERPSRKTRKDSNIYNGSLLNTMLLEMKSKVKGGIYHKLQVDFAYNSNHIEGSTLTEDETRYIFETRYVGTNNIALKDAVEANNHFRCVDYILNNVDHALTHAYIKRLHQILKAGADDINDPYVVIGDYKVKGNYAGDRKTTSPGEVSNEISKLLKLYPGEMDLDAIIDFHAKFEAIHPFYDGNGRVGRLIMFKQCLENHVTPIIITDDIKTYYINGLREWQKGGERGFLRDTCLHAQDVMKANLEYFGIETI